MKTSLHRVLAIEHLTPETFLIRIERNDFRFEPGQYVVLRDPETREAREYSIYSGMDEAFLEFLVREVKGGAFSRFLRHLRIGSILEIVGPKGFFILDETLKRSGKLLFISTGTGISPFHSLVKSFPTLDYELLHGAHFPDEAYGLQDFERQRVTVCASRTPDGDFFGRVTYLLKEKLVAHDSVCMLCGNSAMIEEVTGMLEAKGIAPEQIRSEVFF